MIKLIISGCCGKMGRRIIALSLADKEVKLAGVIEGKGHPAVGRKLSEILIKPRLNMQVSDSPETIKEGDCLIDFSNPLGTIEHLALALKYKKAVVIGTTGLNAQQVEKVKQASADIPILFSPNMSLGVNLVFRLVKQAAEKLGKAYKADIIEAHHVHKKDAPSGTAKRLAELIKQSRRQKNGYIKIESIREGEIIGDHQVRFSGPKDTIIVKHSARTRDIFAQGALAAAKFVVKQNPGLYDMQDVIEGK